MITIQVDTKEATRWLNDIQRNQIPFAASVALNKTARMAQDGIRSEMQRVLDRPKPYTLNGTFMAGSNKRNLSATVGLKDKAAGGVPAKYLAPLVVGAQRGDKALEKVLTGMGILPPGMRAVPTSASTMDQYGNMNRKQIKEMIGGLKSGMRVHKGRGRRGHMGGYFVARRGEPKTAHLPPGIYYRIERADGRVIRPMLIFVKRAQYRSMLRIRETVSDVVVKNFRRMFDEALVHALGTAR